MRESQIVDLVSSKLSPFVLLFGFYLVAYGHLSPGGGFQGGAVLASALLMLYLSRSPEAAARLFPHQAANLVEIGAFSLFLGAGAVGLTAGVSFLGNFLPLGRAGQEPHIGFILFLNLVIGLEVGAGLSLICFALLREH